MATRPDKDDPATLGFLTQAVHAGNSVDRGSGAIRTPIVMANSYALPADPSAVSWSGTDIPLYTRNSGANQLALQRKLAALEAGEDAVALASGVAALHAVIFTFLRAGDHVVVADVTYEATWRPLADGADLVVHSLTKYVNGHGDAMGGAVIGRRDLVQRIKSEAMVDAGGVISPFNAWLITCGSVTLPLRLARHQETAAQVAAFLEADPRVAFVYYPGLPSHPQHALAARQFGGRGFGAMIAFAVAGDPDTQNRFVANLRVVTSAVSLGHDESLIVHVGAEGPRVAHYPEPFRRLGHLRFSVGLEDPADLIADLSAALDATLGAGQASPHAEGRTGPAGVSSPDRAMSGPRPTTAG